MKCEKCGKWVYLGPPYHACVLPDSKDKERQQFNDIVKGLNL